jgi:hypothetical protein
MNKKEQDPILEFLNSIIKIAEENKKNAKSMKKYWAINLSLATNILVVMLGFLPKNERNNMINGIIDNVSATIFEIENQDKK